MMTEKGELPFGVEHNGKICRVYELREQLVRDSVEVMESDDAKRAEKSDTFYGICVMARRLTVAGIAAEEMTAELLMGMVQEDYNELAAADKRLKEKRRSFRGAAQAAAKAPDRTAQAGV
jgi:hypothetical protein